MGKQRNITLDILKLIAAYFVVFIHIPFYGEFGNIISALARFAVPIFFMTSGYYCYGQTTSDIKKKIFKIVKILLFASILYNLCDVFRVCVLNGFSEIPLFLQSRFNFTRLYELLVFNIPFSATRLWFLLALIYVYVIQSFFVKFKVDHKVIFIFSIVFIALNLILGEGLQIFGIIIPEHYFRNFILTAYPFFVFGLFYRKYYEYIIKVKHIIPWSVFVLGVVITLLSPAAMNRVALHCGAVLITISLFALAISQTTRKYPNWLIDLSKCCLGIYFFHRPVADAFYLISKLLGLPTKGLIFLNSYPLIVCVLSTLVSIIFNKVLNICKRQKCNKI